MISTEATATGVLRWKHRTPKIYARSAAELCIYASQDHVEGYHKLSAKTKTFFSTAVALWDADFYVKVDDDVHLNLGNHVLPLLRSGNKTHLQEFRVRLEKTETCPETFMA